MVDYSFECSLNIIKMRNIKANCIRIWVETVVFNGWVHTDSKLYHAV